MWNRALVQFAVWSLACGAVALAQEAPLPAGSVNINLRADSPVAVIGMTSDQSRTSARGAAVILDLHLGLSLRNGSSGRIHGVTLRGVSQEAVMGGKGSVTISNVSFGPGEVFPVRIDMQLVRPTQVAGGPLVHVDLDGVLYQDLSFYGPDRLNSRRNMIAGEMEAQRDREHFKHLLAQGGKEALQQAMLESIKRQSDLPALSVRVKRGPSVSNAGVTAERPAEFAFVQFPDSPIEPVSGRALIAGNEARAPEIEVRNKSSKAVKYVELGWLVSDQSGKQYMAGGLPSSSPNLALTPGQKARVVQESTLNFTSNGQPVRVQNMTGFVSQVEFADGKMWVPNRQNLGNPLLMRALAPSAEEQRLTDIYHRKGLNGLI